MGRKSKRRVLQEAQAGVARASKRRTAGDDVAESSAFVTGCLERGRTFEDDEVGDMPSNIWVKEELSRKDISDESFMEHPRLIQNFNVKAEIDEDFDDTENKLEIKDEPIEYHDSEYSIRFEESVERVEDSKDFISVSNLCQMNKTKRHKRSDAEKWQQNIYKKKRLTGVQCTGKTGKDIPAAKMGPPCQSKFCQKAKAHYCQFITEEQRRHIFHKFWSITSWEARQIYIRTLISKKEIKQKKKIQGSRRQASYAYNLQLQDGSIHQVCKPLFASTFGVPERTLMSWITDRGDSSSAASSSDSLSAAKTPSKPGPKSGKCAKVTDADNEFLRAWLKGLPTVDSHYCRSTPTYKEKHFLYPGTTIANLHREYKEDAEKGGARAVEISYFTDKFHEENLSVFIPRKDRCDVCESFKYGNISKDEYDKHIELKDEARKEKALDKEAASASKSVWTMDLQAVLLCPKTMASTMYYKTKLQLHNFTLFNLDSKKQGYCYIWNETEGDLKSEVFSYLQYHHFETIILENPNLQELVIWSDGCGYQNRNVKVANAYSALARKYGIRIIQKFLVAGHTQMECDSMHSTIERKIVNDVFTERDYAVLIQCARIRPTPYIVKQMKHQDFMKMEDLFFTSIRPGKKSGDPVVHALRGLMYLSDGTVKFRLSFNIHSTWEALPHRIQNVETKWIPLYSSRLPINIRKFNDLQSMKTVMPADCYNFFDTLPHE